MRNFAVKHRKQTKEENDMGRKAKLVFKNPKASKFKGAQENWSLPCADCSAVYTIDQMASARAHENFKGHQVMVKHNFEGIIAPLKHW